MANHNIKEPKEYTEGIRKFEPSDKGHADVFNAVIGPLVNNDAYAKEKLGKIEAPEYTASSALEEPVSGESIFTALGKIKKAVSTLISHIPALATASAAGHMSTADKIKLDGVATGATKSPISDSTAVTATGMYALDAVEKNASVSGTLANQISVQNTNLDNLSIGGTNLIKNSATLNGIVSMNGGNSKMEIINDADAMSGLCVKITITAVMSSGISGGFYIRPIDVINNTLYSYNFDIKLSKKVDVTVGFENKGQKLVSATTEWSKVTHTFISGNLSSDAFVFYPKGGLVTGDILYIRDFKVEHGGKATNWSPHPSDLASKNEITEHRKIYGDTEINIGRRPDTTVGLYSTAEGYGAEASGENSHAEGYGVTASSVCSHAEGNGTTASARNAHAEGYYAIASGESSHAEGNGRALNMYSHAEGWNTEAAGNYSHVEGYSSLASGPCSHAEGTTTATGDHSHAEGGGSIASSYCSHAEGSGTTASGYYSHAEGSDTKALEFATHSQGLATTADNYASFAAGKCNKALESGASGGNTIGDVFAIGNGTTLYGKKTLSNAFRVTYTGAVYGLGAFNSSGADYAEFLKPWWDNNENGEDRVGYFVTLKNGKLYMANHGDYIAGITSGNPSIVGNADEDYYWMYERDVFNRIVMEDVPEMTEMKDGNGEIIIDEDTKMPVMVETGEIIKNGRMKRSESWNPELQNGYIERKNRKEWDYVGMLGVLPLRDDGTCVAGQLCRCGTEGIATIAEQRDYDTYMMIERLAENVISVLLK